ncbi:MAG: hypothetical protein IKJ83_02450, partial [Ruminococcus sp.]|nr:hypothetical protein [Ruminococcus sp.]
MFPVTKNIQRGDFLRYCNITKATFISRPNRFIAIVQIDGKEEIVHVKNTGRCKELLREGCTVYLYRSDNPSRKTKYDLVAAEKRRDNQPSLLINLDSQIPNDTAEEFFRKGNIFPSNALIK